MTRHAFEKAQRLVAGGRLAAVSHVPAVSWIGVVLGDHGAYDVAVAAPAGVGQVEIKLCSCPAHGDCSHIVAAMTVLATERAA